MNDSNFYRRPGTAIRAITDAPQVPSQQVDRYQAVSNPAVLYAPPQPAPWRWVWPVACFAAAIGLTVVAPFAMDWSRLVKVAVAVPVAALGWVAWRWAR